MQKYPQQYPIAWQLFETALLQKNQLEETAFSLAKEVFLQGDYKMTASQANRTKTLVKPNPKSLMQAEDLLSQIAQREEKG